MCTSTRVRSELMLQPVAVIAMQVGPSFTGTSKAWEHAYAGTMASMVWAQLLAEILSIPSLFTWCSLDLVSQH